MQFKLKSTSIDVHNFLGVSLFFSIVAAIGLFAMYSTDLEALTRSQAESDLAHNEMTAKAVNVNLKNMFIDLQLTANHVEVRNFLQSRDETSRTNIEWELVNLCRITRAYDQVRILSPDGMELVRVNYNRGHPSAVPERELQDKSDRYYFIETTKLPRDGIYVSPFDLNVEHGELEIPLKPVIRISTPVHDRLGRLLGYLILNYLGDQILDTIKANIQGSSMHSMLINMDGYWLMSGVPEREWNFMYEHRKFDSFAASNPDAWERIASSPTGQFSTEKGRYTFSTIRVAPRYNAMPEINVRQWKLVCFTSAPMIAKSLIPIRRSYLGLFAAIFLLIQFVALTRARLVKSRKEAQGTLEKAWAAAEDANNAKSDFLARMSHEIRTPMNAIIGLTHLALRTGLSPKQRDYLTKISVSAQALLSIINDILDFSRIEADKMPLENVNFLLDDVFNSTVSVLGLQAEQKGLEFLLLVRSNVPNLLVGDPLRLGQVLTNLTSNAIKFTHSGEVILAADLVDEKDDTATIRFSVRDTGIGIAPEQVDHLFQPFNQADGTISRRFGGTGLGLVICKRIVEMMGGSIELESTPGQGSEFSFTLPFKLQSAHSPGRLAYPDDIRGMRVLAVDDSSMSRTVLRKILESFTFDVETAPGGEAAYRMIKENDGTTPFRLVITDWHMIDITGLELAERIKNDQTLLNQPRIILLTSYGRENIQTKAGAANLDGFMLKPFNRSLLFDTIMVAFGQETQSRREPGSERNKAGVPVNVAGARVLLAEDNVINQQVAREILECADVKVTIVNNGREVMELLKSETFDAILMDIQMPEMDGFQTIEAIRAQERFRDLPVIAMTAHALVGDREKSLQAGMDDHVTKPIDPDELMEVLSRWLPDGEARPDRSTATAPAQEETPLPSISGVDVETGLARVRGNKALYGKLLDSFADECRKTLERFETLASHGDLEAIRSSFHNLSGVAGNVGANRLHDILERFATAWKEGVAPSQQLMEEFETECSRVCEEIRQRVPSATNEVAEDTSICPKLSEVMLDKLEGLGKLLASHDVEARAVFEELEHDLTEAAPAMASEIAAMLGTFNFTACHERVREILRQCKAMETDDG